ncbi:ankyrin-2-like isoform X8 [Pomacea canaliculata]|uniref:ankyrin-2-like isoform X8 n=1 Tax=Pomacea canaliculata TaxID=400727 RepID=UPI000D72CFEE|nr:ankyrin-2-like isoform X8 [Pomacea canaliculata]
MRKTRDGLTPLHCAARSGHEAVVDLLLEREAPHSAKTKNGLTPLHMAAQGDHADCARLLLYHKANVDEVTVDYLTPLHVAAHCGNVKTAKLLLDRKCEPNARALNGFTPLHIACKKNRIKVVELLLRYGASIDATTESGLTPLHVASFMGHMNIVIYLIQHNANPDTPTVRGETSLHLAARANQTDIIRILLRNGATVDARAREQQTPLHIASRLGNVDNVVLLLQHGAAADATTKDKYTPLHIAAKEGHDEVAQVLLEHGASHDVTTKKGFTPLHIAAKYGNIKVARLLLQKDADPDVQGKNGLTPLHVATHYNHVNIAQLLLENRANPHASAKNGYTPLHIAAKKDQMDIAATLLEYGAKPNAESKNGFTPLHLAAQEGYTDIVSLLLEKNANVNAKAHNGLTPMHLAAQEDRVPVAEVLVKYGSEIDSQTKAGYTPLHTACHFGQLNMVRFLLDRGASVSATTKVGYTPLHQSAQQGHVMVVNQLLKHGASPNAVTNNGQTPLAIAQKLGYISVVDILKPVTEVQDTLPMSEDKYKVVSPEIMQEPVILDSDDDDIGSSYFGSYRSDQFSYLASGRSLQADDFMPQSPLFGKPLSEQHVYLPYYEAHKIQTHFPGEDSDLLGHGGSVSPLDISFDKDNIYRYPSSENRHLAHSGRQVSEVMHYPSYLERGPDYEEEMRYYQGDTLSPKDKEVLKSRDSVFGDGYSSLGRNSVTQPLRSVEDSVGDYEYDDDLKYVVDETAQKKPAETLFTEELYPKKGRKSGSAPLWRDSFYSTGSMSTLNVEPIQAVKSVDTETSASCLPGSEADLPIVASPSQPTVYASEVMPIATGSYQSIPSVEVPAVASSSHHPVGATGMPYAELASDYQPGASNVREVAVPSYESSTAYSMLASAPAISQPAYASEAPQMEWASYQPVPASDRPTMAVASSQPVYASEAPYIKAPSVQPLSESSVPDQVSLLRQPDELPKQSHVELDSAQPLVGSTVPSQAEVSQQPFYTSELPLERSGVPSQTSVLQQPTYASEAPLETTNLVQPVSGSDVPARISTMHEPVLTSDVPTVTPISYQAASSSDILDEISDADELVPAIELYQPRYINDVPETLSASSHPDSASDSPQWSKVVYAGARTGSMTGSVGTNSDRMLPDDSVPIDAELIPTKQDYMEAQMVTNSFSQSYGAPPPRLDGRAPPTGDPNRFSSYSGSSFSTTFDPDNVPVDRSPVYSGKLKWKSFLISFMVDARGGAMRGCRHSGVRIIIPPRKCSMPTRVTCRLIKKEKLMKPPPMSEGEGLAARILEMGPVGTQFLGPIIIEVPHFASLRGKEREVVVMRSDNGESWYEHPLAATEEAVTEALGGSLEELDQEEDLQAKRITRILTTDFPQYFALVSRVKQEAMVIGNEGGVLSSTVVPQVQAVLPEGTLTKPIRVGLQAQPIAPELVAKLLGNRVAVSPIVTVEPRRRKFHKPITLTIPVPKAAQKGMINQYGADRPTLRLLYSLSGNNHSSNRADPNPTSWEDITENKPITLVNDCVSFTTTVSARFWLIDCQNISEVTQMAAALYREAITVPYMAKFVVFGKRTSVEEGRLRMFCMTDDKVDKTLEKQEKFMEIARSRDIEVLEGRPQYIEMAGNLIPVTKSGDQLHVNFKAFRENRLPCTLKIRDPDQEPAARVAFMKEPKVARGEAPQTPICNLNIRLPDTISSSSSDVSSETASEIHKRHSLLREQGIVLQDTVTRSQMNLSDVADNVQGDWVILAQQLGITMSEINRIKTDYSTLSDQALAMLQLWVQKNRERATGNALEVALQKINREDVVRKCMYNVEVVDDEVEAAAARVAMDQSGFDTFKEEIGITKDSMKRGMSLDVQYDEQDMIKNLEDIKESESAAEESSPGSERGSFDRGPAPQAVTEVSTSPANSVEEEAISPEVDPRRPVAKAFTPVESEESVQRKKEAFLILAQDLDRLADEREQQLQRGESDDQESVKEEEIVKSAKVSQEESITEPSHEEYRQEQTEEYQEESTEEYTEIIETFQTSEDGGKTWKKYKKIIRISAEGTSESVEPIEEVPQATSFAEEAATRLAYQTSVDQTDQEESDLWYRCNLKSSAQGTPLSHDAILPVRADITHWQPPEGGSLSDQGQSPMSEGSYQEEPSPVPEPTLPADFEIDEDHYEDFQVEEYGLKAESGDENFVDHVEETTTVVKAKLPREETPERETGFKITFGDLSPAADAVRTSFFKPGKEEEEGLPGEQGDEVFDPTIPEGQTRFEETLPDGRKVSHKKTRTTMEMTDQGDERDEVEEKDEEEILPDGTVHHKHIVSHHRLKHIIRSVPSESGEEEIVEEDEEVPGSAKSEVLEMFEEPPHRVQETEDIEEILPDGTKVTRHVVMSRMVHKLKTHHESFDNDHGKVVEEYEIEEVVPGTESAFVAGLDSDYEEELERRRQATVGELEEVLDDGTVVTRSLTSSETSSRVRSRSGSVEKMQEHTLVTEERVSPSPRSGSPQTVAYDHGSSVDDAGGDKYSYSGKPVQQATLRTSRFEETSSGGVVESTEEIVEDMLSRGILQAEEDTEVPRELDETGLVKRLVTKVTYSPGGLEGATAGSREADNDTPVITITEDLSTPPDEDEDVPSYFGIKYEASSEVELQEEESYQEEETGVASASIGAEARISDLTDHGEDKMSSSSSEVAQLEDVLDQDAEIRETSEEKTEETDVEEQFSPLSKGSPSKHAVFSFSETSELHSHTQSLQAESTSESSSAFLSKDLSESEYRHQKTGTALQRKLIFATESFEQYEEEYAVQTHIVEHVTRPTEVIEDLTATTVSSSAETVAHDTLSPTQLETGEDKQRFLTQDEQKHEQDVDIDEEVLGMTGLSEEEKSERLAYLAFDNMGFTEEDTSQQLQISQTQLVEEETHEISPEDLKETSHTFEFQRDYKVEVEVQKQYEVAQTEMSEEDIEAEEYVDEEEFGKTEGDMILTYEENAEDSETYFIEVEEKESDEGAASHEPFREESQIYSTQVEDKTVSDEVLESIEAASEDSRTYFADDEEGRIAKGEGVTFTEVQQDNVMTFTKVKADLETSFTEAEVPSDILMVHDSQIEEMASPSEPATRVVREMSSESSSSDNDVQVFDETSGTYVRMPWEIAHQYRRQFSEPFIEQEKLVSSFHQVKSIDMGSFYRREEDDPDYPDVTFTQDKTEVCVEEKSVRKVTFGVEFSVTHEYREYGDGKTKKGQRRKRVPKLKRSLNRMTRSKTRTRKR